MKPAARRGPAGRVAVVTGAARGIGQAIALRLAEAGHAMALGDVRPADETAKQITNGGGEALSVPCDLGTSEGVDLLVRAVSDRFGRCDVLVNCAGLMLFRPEASPCLISAAVCTGRHETGISARQDALEARFHAGGRDGGGTSAVTRAAQATAGMKAPRMHD